MVNLMILYPLKNRLSSQEKGEKYREEKERPEIEVKIVGAVHKLTTLPSLKAYTLQFVYKLCQLCLYQYEHNFPTNNRIIDQDTRTTVKLIHSIVGSRYVSSGNSTVL